jgi:hypothetical protein
VEHPITSRNHATPRIPVPRSSPFTLHPSLFSLLSSLFSLLSSLFEADIALFDSQRRLSKMPQHNPSLPHNRRFPSNPRPNSRTFPFNLLLIFIIRILRIDFSPSTVREQRGSTSNRLSYQRSQGMDWVTNQRRGFDWVYRSGHQGERHRSFSSSLPFMFL